MSSPIRNVALLGASGIPGPIILKELLASSLNVTVITRTDSTATFPPNVRVLRTDFTLPSLTTAFTEIHAVISLLGPHAFSHQKTAIDACLAAHVSRFLPSEFGIDTSNPRIVARVPFVQKKVEVVEYLRSVQDRLSWTVLCTGIFFDWGLWQGWFGVDLGARRVKVWDGGEARFATTEVDVVGKAAVAVLERGEVCERAKNGFVHVAGHVTTQREIVAAVEKVVGGKLEVCAEVDAAAYGERVNAEVAEGNWANALDLLKVVTFDKREELGVFPRYWNEELGLQELDLEQTVKEVVEGKRTFRVSTSYS